MQLESGPPSIPAWLIMGCPEIRCVVEDDRRYFRNPNNWRDLSEGKVAPGSGLGPMMFPRENAYFKDGQPHQRLPVDEVPLVPSPWTRGPASLPASFTPTYTNA